MLHHSGGDNATKVRRRNTCRNSFRDIFLYDPFAHHLKQLLIFLVLPKNTHTHKKFGFRAFRSSTPKLWNALPQTICEADSSATFHRCLKTYLFSDFSFSVCAGLTVHQNFSVFPRLFRGPFPFYNFLQRSMHYKNGHDHHVKCLCVCVSTHV